MRNIPMAMVPETNPQLRVCMLPSASSTGGVTRPGFSLNPIESEKQWQAILAGERITHVFPMV